MKNKILKQYEDNKHLYDLMGSKFNELITELVKISAIPTHQITNRTKELESLCKKIETKNEKYSKLSDITDICGIRIITFLESDVDKVADIVETEFKVDRENSIDKRKLKVDQFGYKSLHYVVELNKERLNHTENKKFKNIKVEIQIRSILQHAWAEIEHDLGYKSRFSIPESFKRNFNRLSALLEIADIEFDRLKKQLSEFEIKVKDDIKTQPNEVKIDQASISSFVLTNKIFEEARSIIKKNTGCVFFKKPDFEGELERFEMFNIKTIGELETLINKDKKHYLAFVDLLTQHSRYEKLSNSLPLFYFQHFFASKSNSEEYVNKYFNYGSIILRGEKGPQEFIEIFNNSK